MSLVKRSRQRAAKYLRPEARGAETDSLSMAGWPRIGGILAIAVVLGLAAAERAGLISVFDFWFASICASAAAIGAMPIVHKAWTTHAAQRCAEFVNTNHYQALCEAVGELIMHHDANGQVLSVAGEGGRNFQIDSKNLLGLGFFDRVHVEDRAEFLRAINSTLCGEETGQATLRLRTDAFGRLRKGFDEPVFVWTQMRFCRLRPKLLKSGNLGQTVVISITRNLSDVREFQQRLEAARAEAALAISLKDRLLANVSHELRTPLNAILGFSEILSDSQLSPTDPEKRLEYARIVHSSAEHLLSVVNLVLDMSKIEAGKFEILPEPFEWEPLVKDCCDMLRLRAESGRIALDWVGCNRPTELIADKRACRQILLNLLANAVKFTPPEGRVAVGAYVADSAIHIHVSDTGIGIAAQDLPRLGEPFFQVRSNYDRSYEGAGLGLSLVRGLVGLHGGTLRLESSPGAGTRVTVTLPLDCRGAGGGSPQLETFASLSAACERSGPVSPGCTSSIEREERKIA